MKKYWTCEVTYDGKTPFFFFSPEMYVECNSEIEAEALLEDIMKTAWSEISPHPEPKLLSVMPVLLTMLEN